MKIYTSFILDFRKVSECLNKVLSHIFFFFHLFTYLCLQIVFYMKQQKESVLMNRNVVEFVTVAAEFCSFLEQAEQRSRKDFVSVSLKILPLLYIKASMLDHMELDEEDELESVVSEDDYNVIRITVAGIMGEQDDYLDVFVEDMKYSDRPVLKTISEDLADIYQDIRNFVEIFKMGLNSTMRESLAKVQQNFELYWGQILVNTMRALHDVMYNQHLNEEDELSNGFSDSQE